MSDKPENVTTVKVEKNIEAQNVVETQTVVFDPSWPSVGAIARVVVVALVLLAVAGSLQAIISSLTYLVFLVVLSIFFAYLIDPLVKLIRHPFKQRGVERYMPRAVAIIIAYTIVFVVLGSVIANIAPRVVDQAKEFGTNIPTYSIAARDRFADLNRRFDRLRIPDAVQDEFNKKVADMGTDVGSWITTALGNFLLALVTYLPWFVLVPVLAFFFLKDVNLVRLAVLRMFPAGPYRIRAEAILQDVNSTLAAYTRAQLISCVLIGTICTVGFYFMGLKYALLLGLLAGVFEFVPLLGPAAIALIVVTTAAFGDNPWRAVYAAIFLIVLRIVQDYVLYPRIVRGGIHLHPLVIILAVLAGEQVAGIPGVFISIPVVAVVTVIYKHILEHRKSRSLIASWIEETEVTEVATAEAK